VRPVKDPLKAMGAAMAAAKSVSFEAHTHAVDPDATLNGVPEDIAKRVANASLTGTISTGKGDFQFDGDLAEVLVYGNWQVPVLHARRVDGTIYRTPDWETKNLPPGKKWIRYVADADNVTDPDFDPKAVEEQLTFLCSFARDVHYTGPGTERGVDVARYQLTVPGKLLGTDDITVSFALDGDDRLRQIAANVDAVPILRRTADFQGKNHATGSYAVHVEVEFFDYDKPVHVTPPPAAEVVSPMDAFSYTHRDQGT
jgi:hypothetical protein